MSAEPTRVVLVKPGDVLILGNVQVDVTKLGSFGQAVETLRNTMGLRQIVICEDDVAMATDTPGPDRRKVYQLPEDELRSFWRDRGFSEDAIAELLGIRDRFWLITEDADASADYR